MLVGVSKGISPHVMSLAIIGVVFIVCFSFFSIVFFLHRKLLHDEYAIKNRFNKIIQFLSTNNFRYLQILAKSNIQLQKMTDQIVEGREIFEQQLEIVREKVKSLSIINYRYQYRKGFKLTREIQDDLNKCDLMMHSLRNVSTSATQYSKDISDLLIEYREISNEIIYFYNFNLALRYNHEFFHVANENIKNKISQASEYVVKFDNIKLLTILQDLNIRVVNFYRIVLQLYTLAYIYTYLLSLKKRIQNELKIAEKSLSSADFSHVETALATGNSNITLMDANLKQMKFTDAKNNATIAIKQLSDALVKIETGDHTNVLIQKNMKLLKDQISIVKKEFSDLNIAFKNIQKFFANTNDVSILNKIIKLNNDMRFIILYYQNLETEYNSYATIKRTDFLFEIKEVSLKIIDWKTNLNLLVNEINEKYRQAILINDELADIKLTLIQLLGIKMQTTKDESSVNTINTMIEHIKVLQEKLSNNYFHNLVDVNDEVTKIREQATLLISSATYNHTLKIYAQRLIYYVNKYRNEHEVIKKVLTNAEQNYQDGKYQSTIEELIEATSIILGNAKESNVLLN